MNDLSDLDKAARRAVDEIKEGFAANGWNFAAASRAMNAFYRGIGAPDFDARRDSIHTLMIAAVLIGGGVRRVLELGTFTGKTTALMAALAPDAEIVTVDLPDGAPAYESNVASGSRERATFLRERDANVAASNVRFIRSDSFLLSPGALGGFDLVWVDAWHRFPNVAWDIHLAFHVCLPGGIVMCDDVEPTGRPDNPLSGPDGYEVAEYLRGLGLAPQLFMKRIVPEYLTDDRRHCKYVMAFRPDSIAPAARLGGSR